MGRPVRVGATARFAGPVRLKVVLVAVLGPLLVNVTVPATVWPALTLAGKLALAATSAEIVVSVNRQEIASPYCRLGKVKVLAARFVGSGVGDPLVWLVQVSDTPYFASVSTLPANLAAST